MLSVPLFFHQSHLWPLEKPYYPPAALLPHSKCSSVVPSSTIIAMIVLREELGDYGFLLCAQLTFCIKPRGIILVESTQIRWFSRCSGRGGWSVKAVAERRPRVSKLGLKGLSDYYSNEKAVEAARRKASGPNKKGYTLQNQFPLLGSRRERHDLFKKCSLLSAQI
jgi:hypothetical protein